ncbi:MAG: NAD(P)H-binding protein [Baekduia sp.]
MKVLVTGASGFAGSALIGRLASDDLTIRAFGRDAARIRAAGAEPDEIVCGDAVAGTGLDEALAGVDVAYYLIHSMETGADSFGERERRSAENFAAAANRAGVRRIVYLGVLAPEGHEGSAHVRSRMAVEAALATGAPELVALRASIAIAARSRSFRFLVRLVERVPVMPLPSWREHRTQPVDGRDVISALTAAGLQDDLPGHRTLDLAGPEVVTYGELIERIRDLMLLDRPGLKLPVSMTPVASAVAAAIAGEDVGLIRPLMEGLEGDLLPSHDDAADALGVKLHTLDAAIEHALGEWEQVEQLAAR